MPNFRSESPCSSRSSPPISPGCEESLNASHLPESFKRPVPPEMRHQGFPSIYSMYSSPIMLPGGSAFHRPMDASGKPLPVRKSTKKNCHLIPNITVSIIFSCRCQCQCHIYKILNFYGKMGFSIQDYQI
jgi:hypothetical protein